MTEEKKKLPMTWNDVTRSTTPLDWRKMLDNAVLTPQRFNDHIAREIEKIEKEKE